MIEITLRQLLRRLGKECSLLGGCRCTQSGKGGSRADTYIGLPTSFLGSKTDNYIHNHVTFLVRQETLRTPVKLRTQSLMEDIQCNFAHG